MTQGDPGKDEEVPVEVAIGDQHIFALDEDLSPKHVWSVFEVTTADDREWIERSTKRMNLEELLGAMVSYASNLERELIEFWEEE